MGRSCCYVSAGCVNGNLITWFYYMIICQAVFLSVCCGLFLPSNGQNNQITAALNAPAVLTSSRWGYWWGRSGRRRWGWRWQPEEPQPSSLFPWSNQLSTHGCCYWHLERENRRRQKLKILQGETRSQSRHLSRAGGLLFVFLRGKAALVIEM